jgi:hypothetical protein
MENEAFDRNLEAFWQDGEEVAGRAVLYSTIPMK